MNLEYFFFIPSVCSNFLPYFSSFFSFIDWKASICLSSLLLFLSHCPAVSKMLPLLAPISRFPHPCCLRLGPVEPAPLPEGQPWGLAQLGGTECFWYVYVPYPFPNHLKAVNNTVQIHWMIWLKISNSTQTTYFWIFFPLFWAHDSTLRD